MDASTLIFFTLATLLVVSSLLVVLLRNVVHCAMALVAALLIISIFFVILQAPMVGVLQVLVYAGAIMVLFLFVIMFLNPGARNNRAASGWGFSGLLALLLGGVLATLLTNDGNSRRSGGVDRIVRQPGDAGEEPVRRFCIALRDRFDSVARRHRWRGGIGQTGAPVLKWCRSITI